MASGPELGEICPTRPGRYDYGTQVVRAATDKLSAVFAQRGSQFGVVSLEPPP